MKGDRERCLEAGMDDYVCKPLRREELLDAIGRQMARAQMCGAGSEAPMRADDRGQVIDRAVAMERMCGNEDLFQSLLRMLVDDAPVKVAQITEAVAGGDLRALRAASHTLKGSSATMAADRVRDAASKIEMAAEEGDLALASTHVNELKREVKLLCEWARAQGVSVTD